MLNGAPPDKNMNLLLTNDDGIDSGGLTVLAEALRSRGDKVFIIAPDANRSGISNAITILNNPVKIKAVGEDAWTCSGTPADCVIAALMGVLPFKPDMVLSGINQGANLSNDIIFSGTAGAARQGSLFGVPSLALSLVDRSGFLWDMAAAWTALHLTELAALWREDTFVNVNIPNSPGGPEGMLMTWPGIKHYNDSLSVRTAPDGSLDCSLLAGEEAAEYESGSDIDAVSRNLASVSSVYNYPAVRKDLCPGAPCHASVSARPKEKSPGPLDNWPDTAECSVSKDCLA